MLRRYSRLWLLSMAAILLAPIIVQICSGTDTLSPDENRMLSPLPRFPRALSDLKGWSDRFDAYLRDHFGFRAAMIGAHAWITHITSSEGGNAQVLLGNDGWMFYRGDHMLEQSAGRMMRADSVRHTVDVLTHMETIIATWGGKLVVASPPNSSTIYFDKIIGWPRRGVGTTEYDMQLELLARRNIDAVDLRPVLRAERANGDTYLHHDTHWSARGALAAFNAIATKAGFAAWRIDPPAAMNPETRIVGGDLARMLGIANYVSELSSSLKLPDLKRIDHSIEPVIYEMAADKSAGPTILVIGDSFTIHYFAPMLAASGARAIWMHYQSCGFDWRWVEKFRPDQVWYLANERYFPCDLRKNPRGMPTTAAVSADGKSPTPSKL